MFFIPILSTHFLHARATQQHIPSCHLGAYVASLTLLPQLAMLDGASYLVVMGMKSDV
jgi:hypothetical protein